MMNNNRRKVLRSQSRGIVYNVYKFMKNEADLNQPINLKSVQSRVAAATGVSVSSLKRIVSEGIRVDQQTGAFTTPNKKRSRRKVKTEMDDFDKCVVRRTIYDFHETNGERPTVRTLLPVLREKVNFSGSSWALRKIISDLGFRWRKTANKRKLLTEKEDIREKRLQYLRAIQNYRNSGRPIIYVDETYVHSSHTTRHSWSDDKNKGLLAPVSKGKRAIIVHAGGDNGFIPNALLIFKSGTKSSDYHNDMNFENFEKWLRNKLIPNLPPNSVLVIDNASYHNIKLNPSPTSSSRKEEMMNWLSQRGIPFHESMYKAELYKLIKSNKERFQMFKIDALLAEHGHSVLRLPPYHPDLNAIELIWATIKEHLRKKNVTFTLDDAIKIVEEKFQTMGKDEWASRCSHVRKCEEEYLKLEQTLDTMTEQIVINLRDDSSNDSDNSSNNGEESDAEGTDTSVSSSSSDTDMSGIHPL